MARLRKNSLLQGLSGAIGKELVFKPTANAASIPGQKMLSLKLASITPGIMTLVSTSNASITAMLNPSPINTILNACVNENDFFLPVE